ncbi:BTB/POZ and MATH domain-containing protein 1-like [Hordeum vulgare subsp. vulgare]|uniref:BTB domain-containing protein n=1 Tax=Hordeum vulgare subsp. vulgare TaxID=112509 RepID=A0A8I6WUE1_HORVV|nr:BTB/POZ and MATH domain-containing protein 1-like [Hordeum vulgare subsp. vulgare]
MTASERPTDRAVSVCTPTTARTKLVFEIVGYSLHKGIGAGKFIQSKPVSVGGYEWCIRYYPDGDEDHVAVYLELLSKGAKVRLIYDLRLVNHAVELSTGRCCPKSSQEFDSLDANKGPFLLGRNKFKKRSELERSPFLRDDCLMIECDLTVIMEPLVEEIHKIHVPPSDLADNLGTWLDTGEEADVTFNVRGETFPAHKIVLAMRSPVFKAQLYGPMGDKTAQNITVDDMQPAVFKDLLQFIYKDSLPFLDDLDDEKGDMVKHLLVAADRYAMERMKIICEATLSKSLTVETVAATLALADQYHCSGLKDACIEFAISCNRMGGVVASQGYVHLKRSCPAVLGDILERVTKSPKVQCS